MKSSVPVVVNHPCALFRDGLRQILTHARFRPVHMAPDLDDASRSHLVSAETCIWLIGIERWLPSTDDHVRRVVTVSPGVKPVVLAASPHPHDVVPALQAGARGFLSEDISSERLIKALELIVLGETVVQHELLQSAWSQENGRSDLQSLSTLAMEGGITPLAPNSAPMEDAHVAEANRTSTGTAREIMKNLSRREVLILRTLMEGASNKAIARQLVITESTVKVHVKAILRKLRLRNRTQAAMWARNHLPGASSESAPSYEKLSRASSNRDRDPPVS